MQITCAKIKLRDGTESQVQEWATELNRREDEVRAVLKAEGVTLETVFLDKQADGFYLIYIMKSDDFKKSQEITKASEASIEAYHRAFKKACWESVHKLEQLVQFEAE